tara:strand:+ start:116 stop:409 length:294 start_codon:yes stop_codon:yes gene_type:complete
MDYKKYYQLSTEFNVALKNYVVERNEVDDSYYVAKVLLSEMSEKAYRDNDYLQIAGKWFNGGKTLELKEALRATSFDWDDNVHFNAMCLMDSVSACS